MLKDRKNTENSSKLIDAMYVYSRCCIENKQDLNKKIESRTLACLAFAGIEIKLISDLFNHLPDNLLKGQQLFFTSWKFIAIISVVTGAVKFINSLRVIAVFSRIRGNKILERFTVQDCNTPHSCDYRYNNETMVKTVGIQEILANKERYNDSEEKFKYSIIKG